MTKHEARPNEASKRPYQAPTLQAYGDVRSLTNSKGATGMLDGGAVVMWRRSIL